MRADARLRSRVVAARNLLTCVLAPAWRAVVALALLASSACREAGSVQPDLLLLVTIDALRADAIELNDPSGAKRSPTATPELARLSREATWSGSAVAAASWSGSAMASLWTGLSPWHHGVLHPLRARLDPGAPTLAERLAALGYRGSGFSGSDWFNPNAGWTRGLEHLEPYGKGRGAVGFLREPAAHRRFVWVHIAEALPPYQRSGKGGRAGELPERLRSHEIERWADPAQPPSPAEARALATLYRHDVGRVDAMVGRLIAAARNGSRNPAIVVAGVSGVELGDGGSVVGSGATLRRAALEVPIWLLLPAGAPAPALPSGGRVAAARLAATLVELAGGTAPPALAASLFHQAETGITSELYLGNGHNEFSLLEGDTQLLIRPRFAPASDAYFSEPFRPLRPSAVAAIEHPALLDPAAIELWRAFERTRPLSGGARGDRSDRHDGGEQELWQWLADGSIARLAAEPAAVEHLRGELTRRWLRFIGEERSPVAESELRFRDRRLGILPFSRPAGPTGHNQAVFQTADSAMGSIAQR